RTGELVYTGTRRTPVCALLGEGVAAELFATTLDVYLRLGMIADDPNDTGTADGRPATADHAHSRLCRILGGDSEDTSREATEDLARAAFDQQRMLIRSAIRRVAARLSRVRSIILSGSGEFLARLALADMPCELGESFAGQNISLAERL